MAGSCSTGGSAAGWKRHIVRQLRQRDRMQKALFLELVPACECAPGDLGDGRGGDGAQGECLASPVVTQAHQSLPASEASGLLDPLSVTPLLRLVTFLPFPT